MRSTPVWPHTFSSIRSWRVFKPIAFFLISSLILASMPVGRALWDAWEFPWFGHPDQDLVFLRDGYRLSMGQSPLFGDHPGALQMVVCAIATKIVDAFRWLRGESLYSLVVLPTDDGWQDIFRWAKLINGVGVVGLLVSCSWMLSKWIGRGLALIWVLAVALSLGTQVEIYQLRNELYSAFLFFLAAGLCFGAVVESFDKQNAGGAIVHRGLNLGQLFLPSLVFLTGWLSLLAKIQSIPMFFMFDAAMLAWLILQPKLQFRISAVRSVQLALAVAALGLLITSIGLGRFDLIVGIEPFLIVLAIALPPAFIFTLNYNSPAPRANAACVAVLVAIFFGVASLVVLPGWLDLLLKPSMAFQYVDHLSSCNSLLCRAGLGMVGIRVLFERSIDGNMLALFSAFLTLVMLACTVVQARFFFENASRPSRSSSLMVAAVWCYVVAIIMATLGAQRYAVDDYLNYQQPLLFFSMLACVPIARGRLKLFWQILIVALLLSLILIFGRYSSFSLKTYVGNAGSIKEGRLVWPIGIGGLCSGQHKGSVWGESSLALKCGWKQMR